jgi:hypothetical protein
MDRSPHCRITPRFPTMLGNARFSSPQCWNETFYVATCGDRSPQCRITPRFPTMLGNARFSYPQCWNETFNVVGSSSLKIMLSFIAAT